MASSTSMLHLTHTLTLLLLLMAFPPSITSTVAQEAAPAPIMRPMSTLIDEGRRRLGSFQICALCTCCGGPRRLCLPSPCCYAINCNIPNRPFGFCSFTPKTCNCFGCHL